MSYVFVLHLLPQLLIGFEDKIGVSRMARKLNRQEVSSLFAVQFSERSGLVKDSSNTRWGGCENGL